MFLSVIVISRDGNWTPTNGGESFIGADIQNNVSSPHSIDRRVLMVQMAHRYLCSLLSLCSLPWNPGISHEQDHGKITNSICDHELHPHTCNHYRPANRRKIQPQRWPLYFCRYRESHYMARSMGVFPFLAQSHLDDRYVGEIVLPALAWLIAITGAFDSCVHISEEAANATKAVVSSPQIDPGSSCNC